MFEIINMSDFMLLIRGSGEYIKTLFTRRIQECEAYIGKPKQQNKLVAAHPVARHGKIISGKP